MPGELIAVPRYEPWIILDCGHATGNFTSLADRGQLYGFCSPCYGWHHAR